jgi:hypothetical protein
MPELVLFPTGQPSSLMPPPDLSPAPPGAPRDGSSPERALLVHSVAEEYQWMFAHLPGFMPKLQALHQIDGRPFDVLTWRNEEGEERTVYFDISPFFGGGGC